MKQEEIISFVKLSDEGQIEKIVEVLKELSPSSRLSMLGCARGLYKSNYEKEYRDKKNGVRRKSKIVKAIAIEGIEYKLD